MAIIQDGTVSLHINGASNGNEGYRQFSHAKVCAQSWTNIMTFTITSNPSFPRIVRLWVNSWSWRWSGSGMAGTVSEARFRKISINANINTNGVWSNQDSYQVSNAGNDISSTGWGIVGSELRIEGIGYAGNDVMMGISVLGFTNSWDRMSVTYN